ncbi:hypothetical protein CH63R_08616 [Colletotrichum higginsianum IMI 349063]|uniref:Uncharacterized protein n=1 Tax=Colletotrichum higginsianum (strain IMI 349063) TaxID=759273 RepID=A0A1B7Y521_COLHI|nr:hypothetical protein CH63R_08616 [Colletotrichum higginsianum IMI 349063]OBR07095.1 hypothetical protein CH63R_08616 [Colletotrichum higginsianum IMI 349063]
MVSFANVLKPQASDESDEGRASTEVEKDSGGIGDGEGSSGRRNSKPSLTFLEAVLGLNGVGFRGTEVPIRFMSKKLVRSEE